ncbi:Mitogen-activated protein kinase kinase kinase 17 [Vitis vinifera]|uniref:Mitogen-activated protein kinase kinase kinase 17 n=1 Tax=Vitis vinifera TaxID=29760 RepID=A0A438J6M4_VITVI|nr:Mitogen-activated protein kinase kinase kinase 17 [Vitis vinifera]
MENIMVKGRLLGMGNFAHVHLAYCRPFGGQFAVKSVNSSLSSSLLMEETILRRLRCSPDVVYCFGGYSTQEANGDSAYNLVLEYAAGGSLGRLMFSRTSGSPESEVQWYTRMIVRGLHAVHREGFVHCDLKLSNMLLFPTEDGRWRVKIADFGLSKRFGREEFCRPLTFRGTANYMSPESIVYSENEAPLDIWCLGCMVIEMFTGKPTWRIARTRMT